MSRNQMLSKHKDNFLLRLNTDIYKRSIIKKAAASYKNISVKKDSSNYILIEIGSKQEALALSNYLLYLSRSI